MVQPTSFHPLRISFEFFPPKTAEMEQKMWEAITALAPIDPEFVSVTYGAGGTTRERTHATVKRIIAQTLLKPAAHLTCVAASRQEVDDVVRAYWAAGVRHIVALRGDPPAGAGDGVHPQGYRYASELVDGIKRMGEFEISVAAFPEKHPQSPSFEADMENLKRKIDAGATRAITQYFFDVHLFEQLQERIHKAQLKIELIPGILPIGNVSQLKKFSAMCGATVPDWIETRFAGVAEGSAAFHEIAVKIAVDLGEALLKNGVQHLHFYTLNRSELTGAVCNILQGGKIPTLSPA